MTTTSSACGVEVQRLHPAAGAEVERALDVGPRRPRGQGRRCATDAEHVVLAQRARRSPARRGRRRPTSPRRRRRTGAGRTARRRRRPRARPGPARRHRRRRGSGSAARGLRDVDRVAEGEQPHEGRAGRVRGCRDPLGGQRLLAVERRRGHRAEQLGDAGDGEPGGGEVGAQGGDEGRVDAGRGGGHRGRAYAVPRLTATPGCRGGPGAQRRPGPTASGHAQGPGSSGTRPLGVSGPGTGCCARGRRVGVAVAADRDVLALGVRDRRDDDDERDRRDAVADRRQRRRRRRSGRRWPER